MRKNHRPARTFWLPLSLLLFSGSSLIDSAYSLSHSKILKGRKAVNGREYQWRYQAESSGDADEIGERVVRSTKPETVSRRNAIVHITSTASLLLLATAIDSAQAITKEFPSELIYTDKSSPSQRKSELSSKKASRKLTLDSINKDPFLLQNKSDFLATPMWASALWLIAGSRSNPLVTPIANALYEPDQQFLKDRNDGYFSALPGELYFILFAVFLFLGFAVDRALLLVTLGDEDIVLQLAGVSLIAGAALELGRISTGEKVVSRRDFDRTLQLEQEFNDFAERRLVSGGNVHRREIVGAFRRFFSKYRDGNDEYPLSDLEIERLMRQWARQKGSDMSSAGYFIGWQLDSQADIVTNQR